MKKKKETPVTPKTYCKCEYRAVTHAPDFAGDRKRVVLHKDSATCPLHSEDEKYDLPPGI